MSNMIVACKLLGRFGNVLWKIFNTFRYCHSMNIDYDNIVIQRNKIVLSEFYKRYHKYIKNIDFNSNEKIIYFKGFNFWNPKYLITTVDDMELYGSYFYDDELFNDVIMKLDYDFKNLIAVHIRRTDFSKHLGGIYMQSKEKVSSRLDRYPNERKLIFTDDKEWFNNNFQRDDCLVFNDKNLKDYEVFIAMSECKNVDYHVDSTFSQCAKYMNNYIYKKYITDDLKEIEFR